VIPILSVVGRSESGKTTLLEKLIRELAARGRRVGTIKHHYHGPVTMDVPGKDSWRHRQAGAHAVALVAPDTVFVVRDAPEAMSLETLTHLGFCGVDLVLTEGFKSGPMPKIEVNRRVQQAPLLCGPADHLAAVVSDWDTGAPVPHFGLEEIARLADFIQEGYLRTSVRPALEILVGGRRRALDPRVEAVFVRVVRSLLGNGQDLSTGPPIEIRIPGQAP
jgi:molybdopterin-guanine dinucleotide biosynthesis adapter protein